MGLLVQNVKFAVPFDGRWSFCCSRFFPAFRLQKKLWENTLGTSKWMKIHRMLTQNRLLTEYAATHGGSLPKVSPVQAAFSCVFGHPHAAFLKSQHREKERLEATTKRVKEAVRKQKEEVETRNDPANVGKSKNRPKKRKSGKSAKVVAEFGGEKNKKGKAKGKVKGKRGN